MSEFISGWLSYPWRGLRKAWNWLGGQDEDDDISLPQPQRRITDQQKQQAQRQKRKKKRVPVKKRGETPSCSLPKDCQPETPPCPLPKDCHPETPPCPLPKDCHPKQQTPRGASHSPQSSQSTRKLDKGRARKVQSDSSSVTTHACFTTPGTRFKKSRQNTGNDSDDGEVDAYKIFEDSDDMDGEDCFEQNTQSSSEEHRTWFEMTEEAYANESCVVDESDSITLSDKQVEKFKREENDRIVYQEFVENPQKLLKNNPEKYKRCQIKIESAHRSVARVLDKRCKYAEILLDGRSNAGRTYMDDEVVVQVLSEPGQKRHHKQRRTDATPAGEERAYGKVVGLLKRSVFAGVDCPVVYCRLDKTDCLMKPLCKTVPKIHAMNDIVRKKHPSLTKTRIEVKTITPDHNLVHKQFFDVEPDKRDQYVFKVAILDWKASCHYPLGAVLDVNKYGSDYSSQLDVLTMQYRVPKLFPKVVVEETKSMSEQIVSSQRGGREDLTGERVFTIDGPDSKDLDDAISLKKDGSHYIIGVHISDVASVIKKDSHTDREASRRSVTFYPCQRQPYPMLPEPLCQNVCSLLPGKERLTLSVFFKFDLDENLTEQPPIIKKSVIMSCQQLDYAKVQSVIDGCSPTDVGQPLQDDIRILHKIATCLRKTRKKKSTMFTSFADPRLPDPLKMTDDKEAHALIEELMILANSCIASRLSKDKRLRDIMLIRSQKAPTMEQLSEWRNREGEVANLIMRLQGRRISKENYLNFSAPPSGRAAGNVTIQRNVWQKLRRHLEQGEKEEAENLAFMDDLHPFQFLATKHWMDLSETALYKCNDGLNEPEMLHFDLDLDVYTHFTSPIRRYPDLHVQRVLHAHLDKGRAHCHPEHVREICAHINATVSKQKAFQKGSKLLKLADSLRDQPLVFRAYVEKVDTEKLTVCIPSLCQLSEWKQEVRLSMLGVSCQPELTTDTARQQSSVTLLWKRRLYYYTTERSENGTRQQNTNRNAGRNYATILPSDQLCVSVKCEQWRSILQDLSSTQPAKLEFDPSVVDRMQPGTDCTPFSDSHMPSQQPVQFEMTYTPGQVLKLQMSAEAQSGTLKLRQDTLHVASNVKLCTQHVSKPIPALCSRARYETANLDFSTCKSDKSACTKYLKTWIPLTEMEAAVTAARSQDTIVIENVVTRMKQHASQNNTRYYGSFALNAMFCNDRGIDFGGKTVDSSGQKKLKTGGKFALDFLCLRYESECSESVQSRIKTSGMSVAVDKKYTWLAHGKVVNVDHKKRKAADCGHLEVTFQLSSASPRPPKQLMMADGPSLAIEILPKLDTDRRIQEMLDQLRDPVHVLPRAIAMDGALPPLDDDYKEAVQKLIDQTDMEVTGTDGTRPLPQNNPSQKEAIRKALTNSLALIRGPPGTGKTNTGIKLVQQFCEVNRQLQAQGGGKRTVMYCGPSNKSVDLVARELRAKLGTKCPKIVRVYGALIENNDYPVPGYDSRLPPDARSLQSDPALKETSLHHLIRQSGRPHANDLRGFDAKFSRCIARPSQYSFNGQDLKDYRKVLFQACKEELQGYECILTTCAVGASYKLVEGTAGSKEDKSSVFQMIIDECGMCTEPDTLAPIIATRARQVVLIGDHQQLRPIVMCQHAAGLGLERSLFERLIHRSPQASAFLDIQYRMHPELCAFPSNEFYEGHLETRPPSRMRQEQTWNVDPLPFWPRCPPQQLLQLVDRWTQRARQVVPHLLVDVRGVESMLTVSTEEGHEKSRSNEAEAEKVMEILAYLKTVHNVNLKKVKVLTQYKSQQHLLEAKLTRACDDPRNEVFDIADKSRLIGTVVSSQGDEWDYVVLSTVRSLPPYKIEGTPTFGWCLQMLGFITDRNQINVALTRARRGLFIVGNVDLLKCDEVWSRLVERYRCLGCIREAREFPPHRQAVR